LIHVILDYSIVYFETFVSSLNCPKLQLLRMGEIWYSDKYFDDAYEYRYTDQNHSRQLLNAPPIFQPVPSKLEMIS